MPNQVLVSIDTTPAVTPPMGYAFTYRILKSSDLSDKGGLRGVLNEPVFTGTLNQGSAQLQLALDHFPAELTFGDVIRVSYPGGEKAGYWKYEKRAAALATSPQYTIDLIPLVSELSDADFNANYTADTAQLNPPLGTATIDVPVLAAAARSQHVKPGTVLNDGVAYGYSYNNGSAADPLAQAMLFGGSGWWWYVDHLGVLTLRNTSPFTHDLLVGTEVSAGQWADDIISLFNGQPVVGGQPANATTQLTAFAQDTNPANPYSTVNIGRRTNKPYSDSSLLDQASVNAVAANLLAFNERVSSLRTLTLQNYRVRRPQPGDAILLREPADPGLPVSGTNPVVVNGPFLIVSVTEYGATWQFDVVINASMVVPVSAFNPNLEADQAIAKLMQNPTQSAVSPNGAVGNIGSGVLGGGSSGGTVFAAVPSRPVGLFATTGLDLTAQTNNAWVNLTWSAPPPSDVVVRYDVQWRRSTDPDVPASYYHTTGTVSTGIKVGGLIQGIGYTFQVRAWNDIGAASLWSVGYAVTAALDAAAPGLPAALKAYRSHRGALVFWDGTASSAAGDLQGYLLQVNINNDGLGFRAVNLEPMLATSYQFVAPALDGAGNPVLPGSVLVFQLAAVDWTGNQSAWTQASADVLTDGVVFDDLMAGNIVAAGTITGGAIQTGATGARATLDAKGMRLYDGTATDRGSGPGVTANLKSTDGSAFFSGTVAASTVKASAVQGTAGGGGGSGARAWMDFTDPVVQGTSPKFTVNDGSVNRVEAGNLAALGISPAMYGLRVNDSLGAPVFDSLGLIKAATVLNSGSGAAVAIPLGGVAALSATNVNFSLSRACSVLVLGTASVGVGNTACNFDTSVQVGVNAQGFALVQRVQASITLVGGGSLGTSSLSIPVTSVVVLALPAGAFTAQWLGGTVGGIDSLNSWQTYIFQLGG